MRMAVDRPQVQALVAAFPRLERLQPAVSGRDIKGLAKLVAKYCHHKGVPPTLAVFGRCSIFRGMVLSPA